MINLGILQTIRTASKFFHVCLLLDEVEAISHLIKTVTRVVFEILCWFWIICWIIYLLIVGKGDHTTPPFLGQPPLSMSPPLLETQDSLTFYRPIRKTKVLNESSNRLLCKFYPQSILILEEYLLKRWTNLI